MFNVSFINTFQFLSLSRFQFLSPACPCHRLALTLYRTAVLSIVIDKRMPLLAFKRHLAFIIHTPTRRFCVYKQYSSRQEVSASTTF